MFREIEEKFVKYDGEVSNFIRKCLEIDPERRPSAESLFNMDMFEGVLPRDYHQKIITSDYSLKSQKYFSPNKAAIKPIIMSVSPSQVQDANKKQSPLSNRYPGGESHTGLKKKPGFFYFNLKEKLPTIQFKKFGSPRKDPEFVKKYLKNRLGTKSTSRTKPTNKNFQENRNLSLINDCSNDNIIKSNLGESFLTHRSKQKNNNRLPNNFSYQSIKQRYSNIKKLDIQSIKKSNNFNSIVYSTPRK